MDEKALFTQFWNNESKTTSKVLARIPDANRAGDRMANRR